MAALRPESFQLALQSLRGQLRQGVFPPGARITATEIAAGLSLSPTPVRQADEPAQEKHLAQLGGQGEDGLLEGQDVGVVEPASEAFAVEVFGDGRAFRGALAGLVDGGAFRDLGEEGAGIADLGLAVEDSDVGVLGEVFGVLRREAAAEEGEQPVAVGAVDGVEVASKPEIVFSDVRREGIQFRGRHSATTKPKCYV
jgi:hypothetical protein